MELAYLIGGIILICLAAAVLIAINDIDDDNEYLF